MKPLSYALARFVGVSVDRLKESSEEDVIFAARLGIHLLLTFTFLAGTAYFAITVAIPTEEGSIFSFPAFLIAVIVALLILFIDIYIIHASWYDHGRTELDAMRVDKRFSRKDNSLLRRFGFRIAISIFVSITLAGFIDLRIFEDEINNILVSNFEEINAPLKQKISNDIDAEIGDRNVSIKEAEKSLSEIRAQMKRVQEGAIIDDSLASNFQQAGDEVGNLDSRIRELRKAQTEYSREALCEEAGRVCTNSITGRTTTGRSGCSTECNTAKLTAAAIGEEIKSLDEDRKNAQKRFNQLSVDRNKIIANAPNADNALRALEASEKAKEVELKRMIAERDKLQSTKEKEIKRRFEDSSLVKPKKEGILARFLAFKQFLDENPSAWIPFFVITFVTILLEMSAVISKIFFSPKNVYSVKTAAAYDEAVRAALFSTNPSLDFETKWAEAAAKIAKLQQEFDFMKNPKN